jgi:transglutaminase-like putative cysteine protease
MRRVRLPGTALLSLLAALTTWLTMTGWSGFSEEPEKYLGPLAIGCLIVASSGALLRASRLHPLLVALGQLALVALWLNHRFAPDPSILGWLPTPGSVRDALDAISRSADAAQSYAAPVPRSVPAFPPILILVGTLAAVLVDFLACGLKRVPLAGLPLLAMYTAPVSLLESGVFWWKFALIAICFLFLLAGEEAARLAHWGRDLGLAAGATPRQWTRATNQTVWPSARKIGFTATGLAVVLPILIPTFSGGILSGSGNGNGDGGDGVRIVNPMVSMKRDLERGDDVPMVEVRTTDPNPEYLRVAVLDGFDGNTWKPTNRDIPVSQRADGDLPAPPGLDSNVQAPEQHWQLRAYRNFKSQWLPAPYPLVRVNAPGDWRYDLSTMDIISAAQNKTTAGITYDLTAMDVQPTAENLQQAGAIPSDIFRRYTAISREVPDWVGELAKAVTAAGTTRAERAALLQDWFAEPHSDEAKDPSFTYDISRSPKGSGIEDLTDFLRGARTGYCEQFSAAMALMARELDIPSRIAVGFLKPEPGLRTGTWIFSSHDLHAWPELYFQGVGWTRFEPTPASRQGAAAPSYTAGLRPSLQPTQAPTTALPSTGLSPTASSTRKPNLPPEPTNTNGSSGGSRLNWPLVALVTLPVLLLLAATPRITRTVVRRRRWASAGTAVDQAEAAWAELRDSMLDLRLPWDDHVTVRQRAKGIGPLFCRRPGPGEEDLARTIRNNPEAQAALDRIVLLLERARYARTVPDVADVKGDVALCVEALRIGVDRDVRRRADWLPVSVLPSRRRRTTGATGSGLATLSEPSLNR